MNEKVLKPVLLAGAAAVCLWGIAAVLSRPPKTPAGTTPREQTAEIPAAEWERLLPAEPLSGLLPPHTAIPAGTAPSEAALIRTLALPDGGALRLELSGGASLTEDGRYRLDSVGVWRDGTRVQTIEFAAPYYQRGETGASLETARPDFGFAAGDFNFDGQIDFSVANSLLREDGASADYAFHFLWSPELGCFIPAPELDALPSPQFDGAEQTVGCTYAGTELCGQELYRYEGGVLRGVSKWENTLDLESWVLTRKVYGWSEAGWSVLSSEEEPAKRTVSRTVQVTEGNRQLSLVFSGTVFRWNAGEAGFQGSLDRIEVRAADSSGEEQPIQVISLEPAGVVSDLERNGFDTDLVDLNFDGLLDLRVRNAQGTAGTFYRCFLWEPAEGQFREYAPLSGYGESWPDPETQEIVSRSLGGYEGNSVTYLRWEGKELVPVRRVETVYGHLEGDEYVPEHSVTRSFRDGVWMEESQ